MSNTEGDEEYVYNNNNYQPPQNNEEATPVAEPVGPKRSNPEEQVQQLKALIAAAEKENIIEFLSSLENVEELAVKGDIIQFAVQQIVEAYGTEPLLKQKFRLDILDRLFKAGFTYSQRSLASIATTSVSVDSSLGIPLLKVLLENKFPIEGIKGAVPPLLYEAVRVNNFTTADFLIANGADVNHILPGTKESILYRIILVEKNFEGAKYLVEKKANVNFIDMYKDTLLHNILKDRPLQENPELQLAFLKLLLNNSHIKTQVKDDLNRTPFQTAILLGNANAVEFMISSPKIKNTINDQLVINEQLVYPLEVALLRSSYYLQPEGNIHPLKNVAKEPQFDRIVELLQNVNAQISTVFIENPNLQWLEKAIDKGNEPLVAKLTQTYYKRMINTHFIDGHNTPITYAIESGKYTMIKVLTENGANINSQNADYKGPLHLAVMKNDQALAELLFSLSKISRPLNINSKTANGETPLMLAVRNKNLSMIQLLMVEGPILDLVNNQGVSALGLALEQHEIPIVEVFLRAGADVNVGGPGGNLPIEFAIKEKDLALLALLLANGVNVDKGTQNGTTALYTAIEMGDLEIIQLLLDAKFKIAIRDSKHETPIFVAVKQNSLEALKLLVDSLKHEIEADKLDENRKHLINFANTDGITPLLKAIELKNMEMISYLIDNGADLNKKDKEGLSPLLLALQQEDGDLVTYLFSKGVARPSVFDLSKVGRTALLKEFIERDHIDVNATIKIGDVDVNLYDVAKNMETKLFLAPYYETDKPRFKGFGADEFYKFESVFLEMEGPDGQPTSRFRITAICPFCFAFNDRQDGCMYMSHDCYQVQRMMEQAGSRIFVHTKLYNLYKSGGLGKWCVYCNRPTGDLPPPGGHRHYDIGSASIVKRPEYLAQYPGNARVPGDTGAGYFDATCYKNGGGDMEEKVFRFQTLLNFMCLLNKEYIGKISSTMAQQLIRECFLEAPLIAKDFFTQRERYLPGAMRFEDKPITVTPLITDIRELTTKVLREKKFITPEDCVVVAEEATVAASENAPNVPRHANNLGLVPVILPQPVMEEPPYPRKNAPQDVKNAYAAFEAEATQRIGYCEYHSERHYDGRDLYQFFHRQPVAEGAGIYDHKDHFICKEGLVEFIQYLSTSNTSIICYDPQLCKGHFHPAEVQPFFTEEDELEIWDSYRKRYNKNPPVLRGGAQEKPYSIFFKDPTPGELLSCALPPTRKRIEFQPNKGGKRYRLTRKRKSANTKTRKGKAKRRYNKTRKH